MLTFELSSYLLIIPNCDYTTLSQFWLAVQHSVKSSASWLVYNRKLMRRQLWTLKWSIGISTVCTIKPRKPHTTSPKPNQLKTPIPKTKSKTQTPKPQATINKQNWEKSIKNNRGKKYSGWHFFLKAMKVQRYKYSHCFRHMIFQS